MDRRHGQGGRSLLPELLDRGGAEGRPPTHAFQGPRCPVAVALDGTGLESLVDGMRSVPPTLGWTGSVVAR